MIRPFEPVVVKGGAIRWAYDAERARKGAVLHQFRQLVRGTVPILAGFPMDCPDLMAAIRREVAA